MGLSSCLLRDVQVGTACTANADADVVLTEVVFGQFAALLVEGGREHHVSVVRALVGIWLMLDIGRVQRIERPSLTSTGHDLLEIVLPIRMQQLIRFINDGESWGY